MGIHFPVWEFTGWLIVSLVGSLLHFVYNWSGRKWFVGFFAPVNESTWEHLKLLFWPILPVLAAEYFAGGRAIPGFLAAKTLGLLFGLFAIVSIFYTYTGIIGRNFLAADILTFLIGAAVAFAAGRSLLFRVQWPAYSGFLAVASLLLLAVLFAKFTSSPPRIALFRDPNGGYGAAARSPAHNRKEHRRLLHT